MTGLIYTFTNKENGKEYVGQTIQPIEVRDYAHYYEAFNQNKGGKFNNALRKYGKGGFIRSIVHEITAAALPLMFELNKVNAERYADNCCCKSEKDLLKATCALQSEGMAVANNLQRQLDHKIDGQLKYAYSDLCAPVPSIAPLYCSPFTSHGTGMYAGTAAANFNAVNTAINTVADRCPSCTAQ